MHQQSLKDLISPLTVTNGMIHIWSIYNQSSFVGADSLTSQQPIAATSTQSPKEKLTCRSVQSALHDPPAWLLGVGNHARAIKNFRRLFPFLKPTVSVLIRSRLSKNTYTHLNFSLHRWTSSLVLRIWWPHDTHGFFLSGSFSLQCGYPMFLNAGWLYLPDCYGPHCCCKLTRRVSGVWILDLFRVAWGDYFPSACGRLLGYYLLLVWVERLISVFAEASGAMEWVMDSLSFLFSSQRLLVLDCILLTQTQQWSMCFPVFNFVPRTIGNNKWLHVP